MFIQPYQLDELKFAWCYRVYYRWRTHRARSQPALAKLDRATLDALLQPYEIHVLEATTSETDVKLLVSLLPAETVAAGTARPKDASANGCVSNCSSAKHRNSSAEGTSPALPGNPPQKPSTTIWSCRASITVTRPARIRRYSCSVIRSPRPTNNG